MLSKTFIIVFLFLIISGKFCNSTIQADGATLDKIPTAKQHSHEASEDSIDDEESFEYADSTESVIEGGEGLYGDGGDDTTDNLPRFCPSSFNLTMTGSNSAFGAIPRSLLYTPYLCGLNINNSLSYFVEGGKAVMKLLLDRQGCPNNCNNYDYRCAEASTSNDLGYGAYTFTVKPSQTPGVITSCYASNNLPGRLLSEVYFRFNSNSSMIYFGCYSERYQYQNQTSISFDANKFLTLTFNLTEFKISWYINGVLLGQYKQDWEQDSILPSPPLRMYTSIYNDPTLDHAISNKQLPAIAYIHSISYAAAPCTNKTIQPTQEPYHWTPNPLLFNKDRCTYSRPEFVFNDSFVKPWEDKSQTLIRITPEARKNGENGLAFDIKERTMIYFHSRKQFTIWKHKYLVFWINGGKIGGQQIVINMIGLNRTIVGNINLGNYIRGGIKKDEWKRVVLPLRSISYKTGTKYLVGFSFAETYSAYLGMVYVDDVHFSNGTVCLNREKSISYYESGRLKNGANGNYSTGVDFKSKQELYRSSSNSRSNTILWYVKKPNNMIMSFENGTLSTTEYDGLLISVMYIPNVEYQFPNGEASDDMHQTEQVEPRMLLNVQVNQIDYLPITLSNFLGGEFPNNKWVDLVIPWFDLSVNNNEEINAIILSTDNDQYQGKLHIGRINAIKFADRPLKKSSRLSNRSLRLIPSLLNIYIFIFIFIFNLFI
ncbi:hypothetical protein DLAC_01593 [Tieghemostelium lacteum]|uniref:GH16 domain-containing protein n=1 Tax=Tieghemostelium lacteum TaxID=361077 RepID=A0A152A5T9_TIELA|nr:hypothetical protein DLAC_01593 [Tieghemostelium lacteum]|eukprot:KYR01592.1 hypothetical protein DLAC_01593 [Tieghemostelium lacteum]